MKPNLDPDPSFDIFVAIEKNVVKNANNQPLELLVELHVPLVDVVDIGVRVVAPPPAVLLPLLLLLVHVVRHFLNRGNVGSTLVASSVSDPDSLSPDPDPAF
jgi:hypothetical protein